MADHTARCSTPRSTGNPALFVGKRPVVGVTVGDGDQHDVACHRWRGAGVAGGAHALAHHAARSARGFLSDYIASPLYDAPLWLADSIPKWPSALTSVICRPTVCRDRTRACSPGAARLGRAPVIVDREVVHAIRARKSALWCRPREVHGGDTVHLIDGPGRLETRSGDSRDGYVRGLNPWWVISACPTTRGCRGSPAHRGRTGLRFVGFPVPARAYPCFVAKQSVHVAKRIADELDRAPSLTP